MKISDVRDKIDVTGSNLSGSKFSDVNLAGAVFDDVNLSGAEFRDVNFAGAKITNVNLAGARLSDANLCGMSFLASNWLDARIDGILVSDLLAAYRERL